MGACTPPVSVSVSLALVLALAPAQAATDASAPASFSAGAWSWVEALVPAPALLARERDAACGACVATVRGLAQTLQMPYMLPSGMISSDLAQPEYINVRRFVGEDAEGVGEEGGGSADDDGGVTVRVPYLYSEIHVADTLHDFCMADPIVNLKLSQSWFGRLAWVARRQRTYDRSKLQSLPAYVACDRLAKGSAAELKRAFVNWAEGGGPPRNPGAQAEVAVTSVCAAACAGPPVGHAEALLRDPTVALRLLPLLVLALALPGLMIPVLFPKPRKPVAWSAAAADDDDAPEQEAHGKTKGKGKGEGKRKAGAPPAGVKVVDDDDGPVPGCVN